MFTALSPLFSRAATTVRPEDLLLQKGSWVRFSEAWTGTWAWAKGNLFVVKEEPILVKYPVSRILPGDDWVDLALANSNNGLKLYPDDVGILYEIAVGFKPGDYIVHLLVPKAKDVLRLGQTTMYMDITDTTDKLYLGAKHPQDSPHTGPLLFLYAIKDAPAIYLRPYALGSVSWEKVTLEFHVNKCKLERVVDPTAEKVARAKRIAYYTELTGF